jgi:HlyD family secretion protein
MPPLLTRLVPLAALAVVGTAFAGWTAWRTVAPHQVPALADLPQQAAWTQRISASGLIEGDGTNTAIGVPETALVAEVAVRVGQMVKTGDLLFRLDDRLLRADLAVAESELSAAQAELASGQAELALATAKAERVESQPRSEDAVPYQARVGVAEAQLADARIRRQRIEELFAKQATTAEQVDSNRGAENIARAEVVQAKAELAHAQLASWGPDRAIAEAETAVASARVAAAQANIASAQASLAATRIRIDRLSVRAPRDATVIIASVTVGCLAAVGDPQLVVLADLQRLLVRVEIDESQAWKMQPGAAGTGWIRGDPAHTVNLAFERIEPQAEARRSLAGKPGERLDGRALQVLYRLVDPPACMHPGFMLEVDLDVGATPPQATADLR